MRLLASLALVLTIGCAGGGDDAPAPTFDEAVDDFVQTGCIDAAVCLGVDPQVCEDDVRTDLAQAEAELDAAGEAQCAACLEAKVEQIRALIDADCDDGVVDPAAAIAVCDLDPSVDYDQDGTPDNDADEACAGFP